MFYFVNLRSSEKSLDELGCNIMAQPTTLNPTRNLDSNSKTTILKSSSKCVVDRRHKRLPIVFQN